MEEYEFIPVFLIHIANALVYGCLNVYIHYSLNNVNSFIKMYSVHPIPL